MAIEIAEIAEHQALAPVLARWHAAEWSYLYPNWNEATALEEFHAQSRRGEVPTSWLAFDGPGRGEADLVGSVSLIADDELRGFETVGPWLASLYIRPDARSRGLGSLLTRHCLREARRLEFATVYLFTAGQEAFYAERGWRVHAIASAVGPTGVETPTTVMARATDPTAVRRAVASTWCSNPDVGGAYSYLTAAGTPADRDLLAEPVAPGLVFAGEATWSKHPGTLHGAWFSGRRAAEQVIAWGEDPVIVVGAGLAGLAAAHRLRAAGATVTVLEAGDAIGGRLREDTTTGATVNLGGAWLHGRDRHPLVALDPALGAEPFMWADGPVFATGAGRVADSVIESASRRYDEMEQVLFAARKEAEAGAAVGPILRTTLDQSGATGMERTVLAAWWRSEFENLFAGPIDDLSFAHGAEPYQLPGGDHLLTGSTTRAVTEAANGLDIRFGRRVTSVRHIGGKRWQVVTDTAAAMSAHAVVVTVPHGVLRRNGIHFDPPLSAEVQGAIGRIGFGAVTKVFATFDEAWWKPHVNFCVVGEPLPALELWYDCSALAGRPTLGSFAIGPATVTIEQMSENELCELVTSTLAGAHVVEGMQG
jgi:monoamine oxidase/GNAT superfamily N-acetyltransferase